MADDSQDVVKVQVKFVTRLEKYRVTEKPFQVPVNLNRRGLSQVINHLLDLCTFLCIVVSNDRQIILELRN